MSKETFRNKLEMRLLGYTCYSDKENWGTTLWRFIWRIGNGFRKSLGIGFCSVCEKFQSQLNYEPVDSDYDEDIDGPHMVAVYGWACPSCSLQLKEGVI